MSHRLRRRALIAGVPAAVAATAFGSWWLMRSAETSEDEISALGDDGIPTSVDPVADNPEPELPVTITDDLGETVTIDDISRIVPLSGSLSEIIVTLGLGANVVAKDVSATFDQVADLPLISHGHNISPEGVLSTQPTLIVNETGSAEDATLEQLRGAGVPVVTFDPVTELAGLNPRIDAVSTALGIPHVGDDLIEFTDNRLADAHQDSDSPPRVAFLYLRGSASVYFLGGTNSGAGDIIEAAGGIDAGKDAQLEGDFVPLTPEAMAAAQPDAFLTMTRGLESVGGIDGLLELSGVAQTPAGQNRRVAAIDDGVLLNYGPRTADVIAAISSQIHESGGQ